MIKLWSQEITSQGYTRQDHQWHVVSVCEVDMTPKAVK